MDLSYIDQFMRKMPTVLSRMDASTSLSMFATNELLQVSTTLYNRKYPELDAKDHVPIDNSKVTAGMTSWAFDSFDQAGQAKWIGPNPTDVPRVDIGKTRHVFPVEPFAIMYAYTMQELMSAMALGQSLPTMKADAQRRAAAKFEHDAILFGSTNLHIPGFLTNPAVPIVSVPNGDWLGAATADHIIEDVNFIVDRPWINSSLIEQVNTVLFPAPHMRKLQTTALPNTNGTLLQFLQSTNPQIREWRILRELATAGTNGGPRIVAYNKDPSAVSAVIPMPFTLLDPQPVSFEVQVNGWEQFGGTVFYYPAGAIYGEGMGST